MGRTRSVPNRPKIPSLRIHRLALGHPVRPKFSHEFPRASCFERKFAIECVVRSLAGLSRLLLYPPADPFAERSLQLRRSPLDPEIRLPPALAGNFRANTYGTRSPTATSTCANVRARARARDSHDCVNLSLPPITLDGPIGFNQAEGEVQLRDAAGQARGGGKKCTLLGAIVCVCVYKI